MAMSEVMRTLEYSRKASKILKGLDRSGSAGSDDIGLSAEALRLQAMAGADIIRDGVCDPEERFVLVRHYINGRTWREIASELGMSQSYVYSVKCKALKSLASQS